MSAGLRGSIVPSAFLRGREKFPANSLIYWVLGREIADFLGDRERFHAMPVSCPCDVEERAVQIFASGVGNVRLPERGQTIHQVVQPSVGAACTAAVRRLKRYRS